MEIDEGEGSEEQNKKRRRTRAMLMASPLLRGSRDYLLLVAVVAVVAVVVAVVVPYFTLSPWNCRCTFRLIITLVCLIRYNNNLIIRSSGGQALVRRGAFLIHPTRLTSSPGIVMSVTG